MRRKVTLNEKQLKNIVKESVRRILNEMEDDDFNDNNPNTTRYDYVSKFYEGFAIVEDKNKGSNFINRDGKEICDRWYDDVWAFHKGFAPVKDKNKGYNFINRDGKEISNRWYDYINLFSEGFAGVLVHDKGWNFINREGKVISDRWYDDNRPFHKGFAEVVYRGKNYWLRKDGVLCDYETREPIEDGSAQMTESLINRFGSSRPSMARRRLVVENAINNSWRSARKMVISRFGYSKEEAEKILDRICSMFRLNHEMVKFIKGCARMYLNGEFNDQQVLSNFIDALNIIKNDGHVGEFDSDLRRLDQPAGTVNSAKDIIGFFESEIDMKYNPTVTEHRHNGRMRSEHPYIGFERRRRY